MISAEEKTMLANAGAAFTLTDTRQCYGSEIALPLVEVDTPLCAAKIALQGAQVLSFSPSGMQDLLWLSPLAEFREGVAIRGGVPICAPWFGVNRREPALPKHGFLRNRNWTLSAAELAEDGAAKLVFEVEAAEADRAVFPWACRARLELTLANSLTMRLSIENLATDSMPLSLAFHSYFRVADLGKVDLRGLAGRPYLDNCQGLQACVLDAPLVFDKEVDRVFEGVGGRQTLVNGQAQLSVDGQACDTVIVWNPGAELAADMADVGEFYRDYVCVERGAAFADEILLNAGECHNAVMTLAAECLPSGAQF